MGNLEVVEAMEKNLKEWDGLHSINRNSLNKLIDEYDKLSQSYNEESERLTRSVIEEVKKVFEDKRTEESILKLVEDRKKQEENLERRILELRKELEAAELEFAEQQEETLDIMKQIKEDGNIKALGKINDLEVLDEECEYLKNLNNALTVKERKSDDELHAAHKALLKSAMLDIPYMYGFGVKVIGKPAFAPFLQAMTNCKKDVDPCEMARQIFSVWEERLQDPNWNPLKVVYVSGKPKEIIDEDDEKLKGLKNEYGENVYKSVTRALTELMEYNPIQRRPIAHLWNYKKNRKATVGEGVAHLMSLWNDKI